MLLYILLSVLTFSGLYYYSARCSHQQWSMHPRESRQVPTAGFLTDAVQVISRTPSSAPHNSVHPTNNDTDTATRGIAVYAVGTRECPPLTGPPVTLKGPSQELVLLHNAFEYQYFYLNKGSTMRVTVHQIMGATNILVLKGNKVLARIQDKRSSRSGHNSMDTLWSDVSLDFSTEQIMLEQFSWAQEGGPIEFSFTSPSSDVYVLLYDNAAANEAATLEVQYDMVLTTYNLEGHEPWCSHSAPVPASSSSSSLLLPWFYPEEEQITSFTCPPLDTSTAGCIIVEAIEHPGDGSHKNNTNSNITAYSYLELGQGLGEGLVEVIVFTTRKWLYIGGISILPPLLLAVWCYCRQLKKRQRMQRYHHHYHDEYHYRPGQQQQTGWQHSQSQQRQEGPNYHFLPPHDGSDREQTESNHYENGDDTVRERQDRESTDCPCNAEPAAGQQPRPNDAENGTTTIPAENVILLQASTSE